MTSEWVAGMAPGQAGIPRAGFDADADADAYAWQRPGVALPGWMGA